VSFFRRCVEIVTPRCGARLTTSCGVCSNRQVPEDQVSAVAENLLEALRFFGRARADAEIRDLPGVSLIFCGLNYAAFNAALQARPIDGDAHELGRLIDISAEHFHARSLRWTYWLCEDYLKQSLRREAPRVFKRHGLRQLTEAPGMYAECLAPAKRSLPSLDVRPVADEPTRGAFAEVMSTAFEIPHSVSLSVYGAERAWKGTFQGYVGYSNGRAVTTTAAVITGDVIGLYSVATLPQHRRLGFAEAIMREVVRQAQQTRGISRTVLQATSSGLSLYEAMGYRTVTSFNVFISD